MKINIKTLLEFFDLSETTDYGDTTAAISVAGEDLNAGLFEHYCQNKRGSDVEIIDPNYIIPTTLKKKGRRLDRWILERKVGKSVLYQTEIKNWCARAINGEDVPVDISEDEISDIADRSWNKLLSYLEGDKTESTNKVLLNMISDQNLDIKMTYVKEPLLILWDPKRPKNKKGCFYKYTLQEKNFYYGYLWVFSCSLYLRQLRREGKRTVSINMPNADRRLKQLNRIFESK